MLIPSGQQNKLLDLPASNHFPSEIDRPSSANVGRKASTKVGTLKNSRRRDYPKSETVAGLLLCQ